MDGPVFAIVFIVVMFVLGLIGWAVTRSRDDDVGKRRLDLIEKGLQHPTLDDATRTELLRLLADEQRHARPFFERLVQRTQLWRTLWLGVGWFLFVINGCLLAAEWLDLTRGVATGIVVPMLILGFAMLTLPAVLRELEARRGTSPADR